VSDPTILSRPADDAGGPAADVLAIGRALDRIRDAVASLAADDDREALATLATQAEELLARRAARLTHVPIDSTDSRT
jgi:hypothetical protein